MLKDNQTQEAIRPYADALAAALGPEWSVRPDDPDTMHTHEAWFNIDGPDGMYLDITPDSITWHSLTCSISQGLRIMRILTTEDVPLDALV